jgi:hypothetical protein
MKIKIHKYKKVILFQDVKPYNLVAIYQRFEKTYCILLQGQSKPCMKRRCPQKEGRRCKEAVNEAEYQKALKRVSCQ